MTLPTAASTARTAHTTGTVIDLNGHGKLGTLGSPPICHFSHKRYLLVKQIANIFDLVHSNTLFRVFKKGRIKVSIS